MVIDLKAISVEFIEGVYLGSKNYRGKGSKFPLIKIFLWSAGEKQPVEILADRARWAEQGGDQLKINKQKISISVGIYSILQKGKEFMIHVFEDILNVSDV